VAYYLEIFFISLMLSIRGFIRFDTVPWRLSKSLCIIALLSPNSPIFPMIACCSLSIVVSILFSLSSMSFTLSSVVFLKETMSPVFFLNSLSFSVATCSAISDIVSVSIPPCGV